MGFYYYNWNYFLFMLPALLLTMWAQFSVKSAFSTYSRSVPDACRQRQVWV